MTGTDLCVNQPNQSRSYLNHLVYWSSCKLPVSLVRFKLNLIFLGRLSKNIQISNFVKIREAGAELFRFGWTDMKKLTVVFHNFANSPTNSHEYHCTRSWNVTRYFVRFLKLHQREFYVRHVAGEPATRSQRVYCVVCYYNVQLLFNSEVNPTRCNNCVYSSQWLYSTCFG